MTRKSKKKYQEKLFLIFQINDNEDTTYQNLWGAAKTVPGEKFTAL